MISYCSDLLCGVRLFVFGSALRSGDKPRDIDVLVLYEDGNLEAAHILCNRIRSLITFPPLDVIALSESEERDTAFIEGVKAVRLWPT